MTEGNEPKDMWKDGGRQTEGEDTEGDMKGVQMEPCTLSFDSSWEDRLWRAVCL